MDKGSRSRLVTFIPHIFKLNTSKPSVVAAADPFITDDACKEYCSIVSTREDKLPNYLDHFKNFTDNVLDIPDNDLEDIAKIHIEREWQFREEEKKEEEKAAEQKAVEMKAKKRLDKKVNNILRAHNFYVKRPCPVKIPFKSTLSHDEHDFYLRAFIKFQIQPPVNHLEEKEYEEYLGLQNKVFDEQSCLMNFSYKVAQLVLKDYNTVPKVMENYILAHVSHRCQRASSYPGHYKTEVEIPLKPQDSKATSDNFQMTHIGHLLSLGWVPWLKVPSRHVKTVLPKDESVATKKRPDCDEDFDRSSCLYKCPVSEDPNAEFLAKVHKASIVMSASAFKTIVDNQEQSFDKEWNIPVRIKSYKSKDENGKEVDSRVIFIDKPLPKKSWLPLQKKFTFFKASAKGHMTRHVRQQCFRMQKPKIMQHLQPPERIVTYEDIFGTTTSDDDSVNCFGTDYATSSSHPSPTQKKKKKKKFIPRDDVEKDLVLSDDDDDDDDDDDEEVIAHNKKTKSTNDYRQFPPPSFYHPTKKKTSRSPTHNVPNLPPKSVPLPKESNLPPPPPPPQNLKSNEGDGGFLDDILNKQESFLKPKFAAGSSKEAVSVPPNLKNYDTDSNAQRPFAKPWSKTLQTEWSNYKIKECPDGGETNVHYQLYSLESTEQSPVKDEKAAPIRILIRHNIHGLSRYKKEPKKSKAYVLYPKLENQVYFGCEVNTLSEIVQQWATLVTRPNTTLLQIRVCVDSGAIIMAEERNLGTVLKEGNQNHLNFKPQTVFSTLNVLFNTLVKMCSGEYLLHHSPKTEAFMKLLKALDSEGSMYHSHFDLHNFYSEECVASRQYKVAPWLAIDTHVLTPFHLFHKKIPATFPMENHRKLASGERKRRRAKANKKMAIDGYD